MRKGLIAFIFAVLACQTASAAQNKNNTSVHKAKPVSGKILDMRETILSTDLSPRTRHFHFDGEGKVVEGRTPAGKMPEVPSFLEGASDMTPSPSGALIAYTAGNGLYFCTKEGKHYKIVTPEGPDIVYGKSVSRNEFGINNGIFWSPDGSKIAFYRKDESKVGTFPLLDITTRTGSPKFIKYPMAGMESEFIQVGVYDIATDKIIYLKAYDFDTDRYLTNVSWGPDSKHIYVQILERSQKHMHLNGYDATDGSLCGTILMEDNDRFVEPQDPIWFVEGSTEEFIYRTDNRSGYKNLYLCNIDGSVRRLTNCNADVSYVGNNGHYVFFMSAQDSPVENHLYKVPVKAAKKKKENAPVRLTEAEGWHEVQLSPDFKSFIDSYSSLNNPGTVEHRSTADGKLIARLDQSPDPTSGYAYTEIELGTVKSADGKYDNWYRMIKPLGFDPSKKYPVILYVYGGPHSQMVRNTWLAELRRWEMYMAQRGYLVYVQDNRGTSNRGAEYEKAIYGQCGQCEMADQMEGVRMLMQLPYVDQDRIGVHGWSYGGFMTISLMTNYPDVFKVGVAGGPVIDWKWYEVMYGERYMSTPENNPAGYEKTSLINRAQDLRGKLLICQGAIDNTVVWEHSLSFVNECIKNNVQVDYFPYPCAEHNVRGVDRVHLMDKVSMYFEDYLK